MGGRPSDLARRLLQDGAERGLREAAEQVLRAAAASVPVGDPDEDPHPNVSLAQSGEIHRDGDGFVVSFNTPYAAKQHEDMRLKHPRGGKAKFLEDEIKAIVPRLEGIVGSEVKRLMR